MKETGLIRRIDNLGRVVLPIHFRKKANIFENDDVEITINESNQIIISKYNSLLGMSKMFDNITLTLYKQIKGTILITDENKILSSYGLKASIYSKEEILSQELKKRIKSNPSMLHNSKIISTLLEEATSFVYPIVGRNGKEIGAIVYIYEKDLLENVSQIISSYAIFISEMLKDLWD